MILDEETGLLLSLKEVTEIGVEDVIHNVDITYTAKQFSFGVPVDASLFAIPSSSTREVKEFSPWDAARIRKEFAGRPASEFALEDIQGRPVSLSASKGKTLLLGFWDTHCTLCAGNGAFEQLWQKYRDRDLILVGIFVAEEKSFVEKFLQEHPASYPVVLGSENQLPRPYQIGSTPTYILVGKDGILESVVEGEKGFADLRELLKKSGVPTQ
jgi:peroxiredoxin